MSTASMNYFGSWNNSEKYGLLFSAAILFVSLSYNFNVPSNHYKCIIKAK